MMPKQKPIEERIETLPLWAQKLIFSQDWIIKRLRDEKSQLEAASEVLRKSWFVIPGPKGDFMPPKGTRHLWALYDDQPHSLCSLSENDVLLVGRDRKTFLMGILEEEERRASAPGIDAIALEYFESLENVRGWKWRDETGGW